MAQPSADIRIVNDQSDNLRVLIKEEGEELGLSRGEVAEVSASGREGQQPTFTLVIRGDVIEVSASYVRHYFLSKESPKSKDTDKQSSGVWDRELDEGP